MNKTILIIKHEFKNLIKRRAFLVMTLIVPVLAVVGIGFIQSSTQSPDAPATATTKYGYVDQAGGFDNYLSQDGVTLVRYSDTRAATQALSAGAIPYYFVIPPDYQSTGAISLYTMQKGLTIPSQVYDTVNRFLVDNLIGGKVPDSALSRVNNPSSIKTTVLNQTGEAAPERNGSANIAVTIIFSVLLALAMVYSSTYMLQGMGEEKENRLMEILLSSVSPRQLLIGKVLGLGAGGLLQVAVWIGSIILIFSLAGSGGISGVSLLSPGFLVLGIVYFLLGYFMFAVIAAGIGAVSQSFKEGQQLASLYTLFAIVPIWLMSLILSNPDSPFCTVLTIFAFTAPTMVMVRMGLTDIPGWQLAASIAILAACVIGGLLLTAKLFKVYLLMYGKRPSLMEILKNLK